MVVFKRPDGTLLKKLPPFRRLNPYLMNSRVESTIFIPFHVDVTHTLDYLDSLEKKTGKKISVFAVVLAACVRTFALRPELNRFCVGTKLYQRNQIVFSFIAKKQFTDRGKETNVKMVFSPYDTLFDVIERLEKELHIAKTAKDYYQDKEVKSFGKLPGFVLRLLIGVFRFLDRHNLAPGSMIRNDPLYCSAYLTNMGSVGMKLGPFHHLFEWGTASLFLGISQYTKRPVVNEEGEIAVREILDFIVSWDDRIADGFYGQKSAERLINFIENPELLEEVPEIPEETLKELQLAKDYKPR